MSIPEKSENKGAVAVKRDRRRAEVAQDLADGFTVRESATSLGVSKTTVVKDRKAIAGRFQTEANETMQEYRAEVLLKLSEIEAIAADPRLHPADKAKIMLDVVKQLRSVYGTDAPTKSISASISADVDPGQLVGYRRFVRATAGLSEGQVEEVFALASSMPRDFDMPQPPVDGELWKNEEGS